MDSEKDKYIDIRRDIIFQDKRIEIYIYSSRRDSKYSIIISISKISKIFLIRKEIYRE